ncbi:small GTP-binding protein domain [Laccaria bicolor S238N-H82]|uniref:Small GTP-binding protein domain n=1 Tax=Laccaria bicolor (strain S238N-H82 / ATCC MYA-4686) TaxID=486041 RepID=B0CTR7_LACBS|nr:small GTP-binding protein domain [Laccaria bicolor S238N-H82]EDR14541.1 small GTP-binding protein domain [Laccaria bicolor S238N-H82]|eukprot:XP_001875100.1 small GTP-binding protein domain [Laccaria bicolor S238N-H82]
MEDIERQRRRARNLRMMTGRFRVLIIGRANSGKTTILQRVCNTTEQPKIFNQEGDEIDLSELNPTAQRGVHDIENEMIFKSNTAFVFHDSRGFEAGRTSELQKVKDFMQKHSTNKHLRDHLHVIWYCIPINDEARPITRAELNFFDECGTGRVPVIVLFTKADVLDAQTIGHLVDTGMDVEDATIKAPEESVARFHKNFGQQLYKKKYPPKEHVYFRDMQNPTSDCNELLRRTAATLSDDTILQLFLTVQKNDLSLSIESAIMRVTFPTFPGWKLFKRNIECREMVKNILCYFPHMKVSQHSGGLN